MKARRDSINTLCRGVLYTTQYSYSYIKSAKHLCSCHHPTLLFQTTLTNFFPIWLWIHYDMGLVFKLKQARRHNLYWNQEPPDLAKDKWQSLFGTAATHLTYFPITVWHAHDCKTNALCVIWVIIITAIRHFTPVVGWPFWSDNVIPMR